MAELIFNLKADNKKGEPVPVQTLGLSVPCVGSSSGFLQQSKRMHFRMIGGFSKDEMNR